MTESQTNSNGAAEEYPLVSGDVPEPTPVPVSPALAEGPAWRDYETGTLVAANALADAAVAYTKGAEWDERLELLTENDWFTTLGDRSVCADAEADAAADIAARLAVGELNALIAVGDSGGPAATALREAASAAGRPIVEVGTEGADWLAGYADVVTGLAGAVDVEGGTLDARKVAVVGFMFSRNEADCLADVGIVSAMLNAVGAELVSAWPGGGRLADLAAARDAGTVISLPYAREAARIVAGRTGAELVEYALPVGLDATEAWMQALGEHYDNAKGAQDYVDGHLVKIVPALEWLVPFHFQNRRWAFVGDPYMAAGIMESGRLIGSRLAVAVVTAAPSEDAPALPGFTRQPEETTWEAVTPWLAEALSTEAVSVIFTTSDIDIGRIVGQVPVGFPSVRRHALHDLPHLGFEGFLALIDTASQSLSQQELYANNARREKDNDRDRDDRDRDRDQGRDHDRERDGDEPRNRP